MESSQRKIRLLYISSINIRWTHLEWVCQSLHRDKFDLSFLLLSLVDKPPYIEPLLAAWGIPFRRIECRLKPMDILRTVREIYRHCRRNRPEVVHTHIFFASLVGLLGALLARVPVRINTRHHASMNHGTSFQWLDRLTNVLATHIVVTCRVLEDVLLREGASPKKLRLIPLGIDLAKFTGADANQVTELAGKYNPAGAAPVIGVIARFIPQKGVQYVIPAFKRLLEVFPSAYLVLAYAQGPYLQAIEELLAEIPPERYIRIAFEENVFALYRMFDVFIHVPTGLEEESFGLTYVEALAAGAPSIFTPSGVGPEFLVHGRNAWMVDYKNPDQIYEGVVRLLEDPALRETLKREGRASVDPRFDHVRMVKDLESLYIETRAGRVSR